MPVIDIMGYMPDPHEHFQTIPIVRDEGIWLQIADSETGQDYWKALKVAGRPTYLTGRILQDIGQCVSDQRGSLSHRDIVRAQDTSYDINWMQTIFRRPKN